MGSAPSCSLENPTTVTAWFPGSVPAVTSDSSFTLLYHQVLVPFRFGPLHAQPSPWTRALVAPHLDHQDRVPERDYSSPSPKVTRALPKPTAAFFLGTQTRGPSLELLSLPSPGCESQFFKVSLTQHLLNVYAVPGLCHPSQRESMGWVGARSIPSQDRPRLSSFEPKHQQCLALCTCRPIRCMAGTSTPTTKTRRARAGEEPLLFKGIWKRKLA